MEQKTFTRHELYTLVWSEPLLALSKEYGISEYKLRKICKSMNIPLPEVGHWQQIRYGKNIIVKTLPAEYSGDNSIVLPLEEKDDPNSSQVPLRKLIKEIEGIPNLPLTVPSRLNNPNNLIIKARENLINKDSSEFSFYKGVIETYPSD